MVRVINPSEFKSGQVVVYIGNEGNTTFFGVYEDLANAEKAVGERYSSTVWQERPEPVNFYDLVVESNGYPHSGKVVKRANERDYWSR